MIDLSLFTPNMLALLGGLFAMMSGFIVGFACGKRQVWRSIALAQAAILRRNREAYEHQQQARSIRR